VRRIVRVLVVLAALGAVLAPAAAQAAYPGADGRIAWTSNRSGNRDVWSMTADGTDPLNLTHDPAMDAFPAWSPDGTQIAFTSSRRDKNWDLWLMNTDGANPVDVTGSSQAFDWLPAWSPDGTRIAFTRNLDAHNAELWIMDADGSNQHPLSAANSSADDALPVWSPDGSRIAFRSNRTGDWDVFVAPSDGSGPPIDLSNDPSADRAPSWSPNGQRLAFKSNRTGGFEIYLMDTDGSNLTRLTFDKTSDEYPTWAPDGRRIAFQSARDGNNEIYRMNADGSGAVRLTNDAPEAPFLDFDPDWQSVPPGTGADLSVTIDDGPDPVQVQDVLAYRIAVTNNGAEEAPAATLTDALPSSVDLDGAVASQGSCSGSGTITCDLGTLPPKATATVLLNVSTTGPGEAVNTATVSSAASDPVPSNDSASTTTTVVDDTDRLDVHLTSAGFSPKNVTASSLGTKVTWTFDAAGPHGITDRSGMAVFDSGLVSTGGSYSLLLYAAAGWMYRCRVHPKVEVGTIKVPIAVEPAGGGAHLVRWAVASSPPGVVFDVEIKRPGGSFEPWQTGATARSTTFTPDAGPGSYSFRARLRNRSGHTLWSPTATISVP
jgi:uncharacterized repeat protein (TIGR01451 family)